MNKPKPIKPFKTLNEEAHFWDTHDLSLLLENPKTPLAKLKPLESEKKAVINMRVQKSVKENLDKVARAVGVSPSTLSRVWIIEKLRELQKPAAS